METNSIDITTAEWKIMRIIWTLKKATTKQIMAVIQQEMDWTESTVKTLLRRLVEKQALKTSKVGRKFIYYPVLKEAATTKASATNLFAEICDMRKGQVITELVAESTLSKTDIKALQQLLNEKLASAPDVVNCNCLPHSNSSEDHPCCE